jgi:hypothetical protein
MIKEYEFYHGAVLAKIAHYCTPGVNIKPYPSGTNASYIIQNRIGLYIKHSSSRMSPWQFSFSDSHQDEILEMKIKLGTVFVALVCRDDGVVCLSFEELKVVLNEVHDRYEWIRVSRRPREKYEIKGSDGRLLVKIGASDFPAKLFRRGLVKIPISVSWSGGREDEEADGLNV